MTKPKATVKTDGAFLYLYECVLLLSVKNPEPPKPDTDPPAIGVAQEAERYRKASETLFGIANGSRNPSYVDPGIVLQAFACELYLKCLLVEQLGTLGPSERTHSIRELFLRLDNANRTSVQNLYAARETDNELLWLNERYGVATDLDSVLSRCDELFEGSRYQLDGGRRWPLDKNGHGGTLGLRQLNIALANTIFSKHPDWKTRIKEAEYFNEDETTFPELQ